MFYMRHKGHEKATKVVNFVAKWLNLYPTTVYCIYPYIKSEFKQKTLMGYFFFSISFEIAIGLRILVLILYLIFFKGFKEPNADQDANVSTITSPKYLKGKHFFFFFLYLNIHRKRPLRGRAAGSLS